MAYKLRCPGCHEVFKWAGKSWPRFCPNCGYTTALPEGGEITAPHISDGRAKALSKSAEQTYRDYSDATARNAQIAADIEGVPVSEMSGLKITNMNTQLRPGDLATPSVTNDVSRTIEASKGVFGYQNNPQNAIGFAAAAHTGKSPHAGANAFAALREIHQKHGAATVLAGQTTVKGGTPSVQPFASEAPTKEILDRNQRQGGKLTF